MNSSGIKRGLAVSAVAALAVTGLPSAANADSVQAQVAKVAATDNVVDSGDLVLVNPDGAPDAEATTQSYNLVAVANADVAQVRFEFSPTGAAPWTRIGPLAVDRVNGAFIQSWTPTVDGTVRVVPLDAAGDAFEAEAVSQAVDVNLPGASDTVKIGGPTNVGVWNSQTNVGPGDYTMAVSGTTSLTDTASAADDDFTIVLDQKLDGAATAEADVVGATNGTFAGVLPLAGYTFTPGGPDQVVIGARPEDRLLGLDNPSTAAVEDAAVKTLYLQVLDTVSVAAKSTLVKPSGDTDITVTAKDSTGAAIAGADVYVLKNGAAPAMLAGQTAADGTLVLENQTAGDYRYHVNAPGTTGANDQVVFDAARGDKAGSVKVEEYTPALTNVEVDSRFGSAADLDEVNGDADSLQAIALDQADSPMQNERLYYTWTVDPFEDGLATQTSKEIDGGNTAASGRINLRLPVAGDFTTAPGSFQGTYTLNIFRKAVGGVGAFQESPVTFKFGQAEVVSTPNNAQGPRGGSTTIALSLQLEQDGTKLGSIDYTDAAGDDPWQDADDVDRTAALAYAAGTEDNPSTLPPATRDGGPGDSRIAPLAEQNATIQNVPAGGANASVLFDGAGNSAVKINDANPETQEEFDAELDANTTGELLGNASPTTLVDFLNQVAADKVIAQSTDNAVDDDVDLATPGRPTVVYFRVVNPNGEALSNKTVSINVGGGAFITDATEDDTPVADLTTAQQNGVWANKGTTGTVVTDGNGIAQVTIAIEKNAGFDDDFSHTVPVSASVDGKSASQPVQFFAFDAVNLDRFEVEVDDETVAPLPDAQTRQTVSYRVNAYDQFGNLSDEGFSSDDRLNPRADSTSGRTNSLEGPAALKATASGATSQLIDVAVADRQGAGVDTVQETTLDAINWYEVDFDASTFTMNQTGPESVQAGAKVTELLTALDQKGNPISDLDVAFLRGGPGPDDSDGNNFDTTDDLGRAFYDFVGGTAGTARVSAVVREGLGFATNQGPRITSVDDTVTFTGDVAPEDRTQIAAQLAGLNNGAAADRLTVAAPRKAAGAGVRLFKVVNGRRVLVARSTLNGAGDKVFTVRDRNGRAFTRYIAVVAQSPDTLADTTSAKRVR